MPAAVPGLGPGGGTGLDFFSLGMGGFTNYTAPHQTMLDAANAKGLEVTATFARRNNGIFMDMNITNRAMAVSCFFSSVCRESLISKFLEQFAYFLLCF